MALKRPQGPAGTLVVLERRSKILTGNPLRDPHVRNVGVWLPPQYDGRRRFPVLHDLVGALCLVEQASQSFSVIEANPK